MMAVNNLKPFNSILDTDNDGYLVASSINTSGEILDRNSSLERMDISPRLPRFDVITEEDPMLEE